jgi:hypothetical protein
VELDERNENKGIEVQRSDLKDNCIAKIEGS